LYGRPLLPLSPLYGIQHVEIPSKQVGPPPIHRPNQKGVKGKGEEERKKKRKKRRTKKRREGKIRQQKPKYANHRERDNDKTIQVQKKQVLKANSLMRQNMLHAKRKPVRNQSDTPPTDTRQLRTA